MGRERSQRLTCGAQSIHPPPALGLTSCVECGQNWLIVHIRNRAICQWWKVVELYKIVLLYVSILARLDGFPISNF